MIAISDQLKIHEVIDELFFEHQKALLHFDFKKAEKMLHAHEKTLLSHMADEENHLLPIYEARVNFPASGAPKLYLDEHAKMKAHVELFISATEKMSTEPEVERELLRLLDREAFYLRLVSHHDKRETQYLYPLLDEVLTTDEKMEILEKITLRGY